jgi:hypothetical protein
MHPKNIFQSPQHILVQTIIHCRHCSLHRLSHLSSSTLSISYNNRSRKLKRLPRQVTKFKLLGNYRKLLNSQLTQISHLSTSNNITSPLINCVADLHIIDRAQKCIGLQKIQNEVMFVF